MIYENKLSDRKVNPICLNTQQMGFFRINFENDETLTDTGRQRSATWGPHLRRF